MTPVGPAAREVLALAGAGVAERTLIVACGALARELKAVIRANRFEDFEVVCLPASLHNRPERIAPAVRDAIACRTGPYRTVLCLYGDCGTAGALDRVLAEAGAERIDGAHCYSFFAGEDAFDQLMEEEAGTFFLTDFLVRHFDRLVIQGLGLDRFPELLPSYFGHYRRVVHLVQVPSTTLTQQARAAAARLGLAYESRLTGIGAIARFIGARQSPAETSA